MGHKGKLGTVLLPKPHTGKNMAGASTSILEWLHSQRNQNLKKKKSMQQKTQECSEVPDVELATP